MGAVYEAKHTVIGKRVAVKVLLEKFLAKSDFVARLLQEARLASSIGHEHIVDVTDFGTTDDGRSFVVMEFLDGESLAELAMREAPLPIERSLRIARQVASALGAAHAKGIVHRDVKPENIYLVKRGDADFVKVVDFGISKAVKPGGDEGRRRLPADPHGPAARDAALHVARAGARRGGPRPPRRHLGAGRDAVRVPDRRGAVPRQQLPRHHLAGADAQADAAVEAAARAGHPRRGRGGRDAGDGEGPRRAAIRRWPSWSATSSGCWRATRTSASLPARGGAVARASAAPPALAAAAGRAGWCWRRGVVAALRPSAGAAEAAAAPAAARARACAAPAPPPPPPAPPAVVPPPAAVAAPARCRPPPLRRARKRRSRPPTAGRRRPPPAGTGDVRKSRRDAACSRPAPKKATRISDTRTRWPSARGPRERCSPWPPRRRARRRRRRPRRRVRTTRWASSCSTRASTSRR